MTRPPDFNPATVILMTWQSNEQKGNITLFQYVILVLSLHDVERLV